MTRQEAYEAMKNGNKITHGYFSDGEYYEFKNNSIIAEDGVDHTRVFWDKSQNNWRETGWEIFQFRYVPLEQIVNTHPCPIIRGKIMENVSTKSTYKDLEDVIFDSFIWGNTPQGWDFWSKVASNITDNITAPYSDIKHLDLSYVPEPAKPPVMWRKIDKDKLPAGRVAAIDQNMSEKKVFYGFLDIDLVGVFLKYNNMNIGYDFTHYIPLSDLINLPQERESP